MKEGVLVTRPDQQTPLRQRKDCMSSVHQAAVVRASRCRGVSYTRPMDAAKEAVPAIDLADRLAGPGKMRRAGETWATNCLFPTTRIARRRS